MNKKIINLGILLVFIFSCNVNTSNNNVEVKPTTSVSSTTSVLPAITPSVQITTIPTITTNQSPSISPTIENTPTVIPTSFSYDFSKINWIDTFTLNKERDGIENGYDGKVLIMIDTHLLRNYIKDKDDLMIFPRKVMVLKDSYDELSNYERAKLKEEYDDYDIFDRNTYIPITEGRGKDSTYDGSIIPNVSGMNINYQETLYYMSFFYSEKEGYNNIPYILPKPSFSEKIKLIHENLKKSNKRKIMKSPIQKIIFSSIYGLSEFSEMMYYVVNYTNTIQYTGIDYYSISMYENYNTWTNCIPEYCKKINNE